MAMRLVSVFGSVCVAVAIVGCGEETVEVQPPPASSAAKTQLEQMAQSGEPMGSGGMEIPHCVRDDILGRAGVGVRAWFGVAPERLSGR